MCFGKFETPADYEDDGYSFEEEEYDYGYSDYDGYNDMYDDHYLDMNRYTIIYEGPYYYEDNEENRYYVMDGKSYYRHEHANWETASAEYDMFTAAGIEVELRDEEYSVTLKNGEWN